MRSSRPSLKVSFVALFVFLSVGAYFEVQPFRRRQTTAILVPSDYVYSEYTYNPLNYFSSQAVDPLSLTPGDLPGYTGWARPFESYVGLFEPPILVGSGDQAEDGDGLSSHLVVGRNVTVRVECARQFHNHPCKKGGSLFFVRAYGRAVLPGRVTDYRNGTYDIHVFPLDPGTYFLEAVLTFSDSPPFDDYPLRNATEEPDYEGHLLPGFPLRFSVNPERSKYLSFLASDRKRFCSAHELQESLHSHPTETGRWKVTERARSQQIPRLSTMESEKLNETRVSLRGYQKGINSLGIRMNYEPKDCSLIEESHIVDAFNCTEEKRLHVIYIGDSNIRQQQLEFQQYLTQILSPPVKDNSTNMDTNETNIEADLKPTKITDITTATNAEEIISLPQRIEVTRISTYGGLHETMENISMGLQEIRERESLSNSTIPVDYYIIFNSGLHDINKRCASPRSNRTLDLNTSCTWEYQSDLRRLLRILSVFPAKLKVFQSSTAGWPKYGNFGFAWPPSMTQHMPRDPSFVAHFNQAAAKVLQQHNRLHPRNAIPTMDAYWLTLARPDHREVDKNNFIGKHLVHGGPEVVSVLVRKWMMMILEDSCGSDYFENLE